MREIERGLRAVLADQEQHEFLRVRKEAGLKINPATAEGLAAEIRQTQLTTSPDVEKIDALAC